MNSYKSAGRLKAIFFILGIILVLSALVYTQSLVNRLRDDIREYLNFYADVFAEEATDFNNTDSEFLFEEIIQGIDLPLIISSQKFSAPNAWKNIGIPPGNPNEEQLEEILEIMSEMDEANEPIPLLFEDIVLGYIHYGDSQVIKELQWLPYIEIAVVALFIFIGFTGYQTIRKSEQRLLWIGMARETAHQLGTPISSLLGWTALLNEKELSEDFQEIVSSMQQDIHRLEQIASRFSEISGREHFVEANLQEIINNVVHYMQRRLPQTGKNISLKLTGSADMQLPLNPDLLAWALENIIKNGVDAIERQSGTIHIHIHEPDSSKLYIDIEDTGKGIETQKDWDKIFKPGYTTKKRGWGLGLSLVRRIIEEYHNGSVTVIQSAEGKGTIIRITLFINQ